MAVGGELFGHRRFRRPALPGAAAHACNAAGMEPNGWLERLFGKRSDGCWIPLTTRRRRQAKSRPGTYTADQI